MLPGPCRSPTIHDPHDTLNISPLSRLQSRSMFTAATLILLGIDKTGHAQWLWDSRGSVPSTRSHRWCCCCRSRSGCGNGHGLWDGQGVGERRSWSRRRHSSLRPHLHLDAGTPPQVLPAVSIGDGFALDTVTDLFMCTGGECAHAGGMFRVINQMIKLHMTAIM